MAIYNLLLLGY